MKAHRKIVSIIMIAALVFSLVNLPGTKTLANNQQSLESVLSDLTPEQKENYKQLQSVEQEGLFLSRDIDLKSEEQVKVIIQLDHHPEKIAVMESELKGQRISSKKAKSDVEEDQQQFKDNIASMFKGKSSNQYTLGKSYKNAMNGIAVELPANKIKEVLNFDVVRAIWSDVEVKIDPPIKEEKLDKEQIEPYMMESIPYLQIDKLHTEGYTGEGIKVGVLDTGIDYNHPDLDGVYAGGYDMVDDDNDPMETTYQDWIDSEQPEYNGSNSYYTEHGTHVAGTIAGEGDNSSEHRIKGVAPEVDLYGYRVLGPYGSGTSENVIAGIDRAIAEGMDVINLSLGAMVNDPLFPTSVAVNNAVLSGVTAVVSAGNAGNQDFTLGSPGTASLALTVGASDVPVDIATFDGAYGSETVDLQLMAKHFDDDLSSLVDTNLPIVDVGFGRTSDYNDSPSVEGKIALISRGEIPFVDKITTAKEQGAEAILLYNNVDEGHIPSYLAEGVDYIPTFSLTKDDGEALKGILETDETFTFSNLDAITTEGDRLAEFSSRGPSKVNYDIKPEIVAPGVNIQSTVPSYINDQENGTYTFAYQRLSGTSMASPHIAGIAALLLQSNDQYEPEDVRSLLMNTADPLNGDYSVYEVGAGRVDPYEAVHSDLNFQVIDETTNLENGNEVEIEEITGGMSFGLKYVDKKDLKLKKELEITNAGDQDKVLKGNVEFTNQSLDPEENKVNFSIKNNVKIKSG